MSDRVLPKAPFKFIWYFLRPYKWYCFGLTLIGVMWAIDVSLRPYLIKMMLDTLELTPQDVNLFSVLIIPGGTYVLLIISMNWMYRIHDYLSLRMMPSFNQDIILNVVEYTQHHSHSFFQNQFGGSIAAKISEMADACQAIVDTIINRFFSHSMALMVACCTMASVHYHLAIILIIWTSVFLCGSYWLAKEPFALSHQLSETHTTLIGKVIDSITNMLTVRLFAREKYEYSYIAGQASKRAIKAQQLRWSNLKQQAIMETTSNIFIAILLCYLIYARQKGMVTIGDFALILTLSISVIDSMWNISRDFLEFSEKLGRCSQTLSLIAVPHEMIDAADATPLVVKTKALMQSLDAKEAVAQIESLDPSTDAGFTRFFILFFFRFVNIPQSKEDFLKIIPIINDLLFCHPLRSPFQMGNALPTRPYLKSLFQDRYFNGATLIGRAIASIVAAPKPEEYADFVKKLRENCPTDALWHAVLKNQEGKALTLDNIKESFNQTIKESKLSINEIPIKWADAFARDVPWVYNGLIQLSASSMNSVHVAKGKDGINFNASKLKKTEVTEVVANLVSWGALTQNRAKRSNQDNQDPYKILQEEYKNANHTLHNIAKLLKGRSSEAKLDNGTVVKDPGEIKELGLHQYGCWLAVVMGIEAMERRDEVNPLEAVPLDVVQKRLESHWQSEQATDDVQDQEGYRYMQSILPTGVKNIIAIAKQGENFMDGLEP